MIFPIQVLLVNGPELETPSRKYATQGQAFDLSLSGNALPVFKDDFDEDGTHNTVTASCPGWLTCELNETVYSFSGTPDNAQVGSHEITLTATDPHPDDSLTNPDDYIEQTRHIFTVTVANVNDAPTVNGQGSRPVHHALRFRCGAQRIRGSGERLRQRREVRRLLTWISELTRKKKSPLPLKREKIVGLVDL